MAAKQEKQQKTKTEEAEAAEATAAEEAKAEAEEAGAEAEEAGAEEAKAEEAEAEKKPEETKPILVDARVMREAFEQLLAIAPTTPGDNVVGRALFAAAVVFDDNEPDEQLQQEIEAKKQELATAQAKLANAPIEAQQGIAAEYAKLDFSDTMVAAELARLAKLGAEAEHKLIDNYKAQRDKANTELVAMQQQQIEAAWTCFVDELPHFATTVKNKPGPRTFGPSKNWGGKANRFSESPAQVYLPKFNALWTAGTDQKLTCWHKPVAYNSATVMQRVNRNWGKTAADHGKAIEAAAEKEEYYQKHNLVYAAGGKSTITALTPEDIRELKQQGRVPDYFPSPPWLAKGKQKQEPEAA